MCETDNLLDIFGPDALRSPDRQTIHLVIRDPTEGHASSSPAPNSGRGSSPAVVASHAPTPVVVQQAVQMSFGPQPTSGPNGRTQSQPAIAAGSGSRLPSPAPNPAAAQPDATMSFHQQHQNMANWISQIQREAMTRAIVHQNQRGRAQMGMRGIGDPTGGHHHPGGNPADSSGGRSSPAPTHTIYREAFGPNGHSFHVETVIRPSAPGQQNGLSPIDVQNILRSADVNQAAAAAMASATAAQRSAPGPPPVHGRPLNQPGVTTPVFGSGGVPTAGSGRATPDVGARTAHAASSLPLPLSNFANSPRQGLEVYILSSPEGPRALLLNNATSEAFYTPRLRPQSSMPHLRTVPSFPNLSFAAATSPHAPPNIGHQPPRFDGHEQQQQPRQQYQPAQANHGGVANGQTPIDAPIQQQQQPQPQPQPQPQQRQRQRQPRLHPANPPAAGIPPLLLRAWPHMWLVIRLAVFVWLFTSPNSSWSRWFTVICLAGLVFLLSTGILNGSNTLKDNDASQLVVVLQNKSSHLSKRETRTRPKWPQGWSLTAKGDSRPGLVLKYGD
ncbi:uncharacterized protein UV8b_04145 [Ustilaginoidea virens]|uniref:Uncharacterized protein n=1 Tax=Ustilaginoidea virens TaxID=1159556 RepID=A0A8E5HRN3_USTVR|nr:uncharacterized protein UV8b_04145 [Ustilaginoidea virens]QUC19904.1 hypothetical protein UV8b_04145 [Ustilaginoidea virens]